MSSPRNGLLGGGNWIVDAVKMIDTFPQQDALANITSESKGTGGSPFNVLLDIALMGGYFPLSAVGLVGADENGRWILEKCAECGIDTAALQTSGTAPTSYTDVMTVQGTGRRTFFHARGANAELDSPHFDFSQTKAKIFHLGYLLLLDRLDLPHPTHGTVAAEVLSRAQAAGLKTSVEAVSEDSDRFERLIKPVLRHTDLCILNEFELGRLTHRPVRGEAGVNHDELAAAMREVLAEGVRERVVVHYPEGASSLSREGELVRQGSIQLPADYIQGAAGAGDAFTAGVILAWHEERSTAEGLRYGVCAAAANLSHATCTGGLRPLSDCLALGERYGFRAL